MGRLERRVEQNLIARLGQTIAEVDVFDRRPRESFIEPADLPKGVLSNSAESGPERPRPVSAV